MFHDVKKNITPGKFKIKCYTTIAKITFNWIKKRRIIHFLKKPKARYIVVLTLIAKALAMMENNLKKEALQQLVSLRPKIQEGDTAAQIQFNVILYRHHLYWDLVTHQLNSFELSALDINQCFTLNNKCAVIHGIVAATKNIKGLKHAIKQQRNEHLWSRWETLYYQLEHQKKMMAVESSIIQNDSAR